MPASTDDLATIGSISKPVVGGVLRMAEVVVAVGAGLLAHQVWPQDESATSWSSYAWVTILGGVLAANLFHMNDAYRFSALERLPDSLRRVTLAWITVAAVLIVLSFLTKASADFSRVWSALWFGSALTVLVGMRIGVHGLIRRWKRRGLLCPSVAVLGGGPVAERLVRHLTGDVDPAIRLVGVYRDATADDMPVCGGQPVAGDIEALVRDARRLPIDMVVLALPWSAERRILAAIERLRALPLNVSLCPDGIGFQLGRCPINHLANISTLGIQHRPLSGWHHVAKAIEDRTLAALALLFLAPLLATIAVLIRLDSPGPVLFRQKRYGFNDQLIEVLKFRTMYYEATDQNAEQLTRRNDPRVTRVGAFLRKTSLDELPQLINVLRGDMSIVGPRPHALRAKAAGVLYPEAVRNYSARHRVKPGITGWAQINGWRGETETLEQIAKRVEHDLFYIENWSIGLDLKIIVRTMIGGFAGRYAY
ncbi:MAG TPA: undecaprenyl-phosphate glucose phosphotransferase [Alphaproteobacteria bacterium]|jgi:Undecaprenyl-phosphate glucose phosphotransferase|nr:undecaprenyl-phosphate glucose phosphotransferase [Alphaproteobacteria bacterium]